MDSPLMKVIKATAKAVSKGSSIKYSDKEYKQILAEAGSNSKQDILFLRNQLREAGRSVR